MHKLFFLKIDEDVSDDEMKKIRNAIQQGLERYEKDISLVITTSKIDFMDKEQLMNALEHEPSEEKSSWWKLW